MAKNTKKTKKDKKKEDEEMVIGSINLTDLNPSENNTRKINDEGLRVLEKSMENFGLVQPILVNLKDGANRIISGHQRYEVLLNQYIDGDLKSEELHLLQLGDLGWVFKETKLELDGDDEETQLAIAMNTHQGQFIQTELKKTLKDLELKGLDVELTGFNKVELEKLDTPKPKTTTKKEDTKEDISDKNENKKQIAVCPKCGEEFEI